MALYFNTTRSNPMQHATSTQRHAVLRQQQCPNSPLAFHVPRYKPKQTNTLGTSWRETCSRQSERPCKCAWVVLGTQAGVGVHPSAGDSQPDWVNAKKMLSSYWISRRTHPLLMCVSLSRKIPSDNFFFDERNDKVMNFDLNQVQNEIWWT